MNPYEMSNEQLRQELYERGLTTYGSREDMISTLYQANNGITLYYWVFNLIYNDENIIFPLGRTNQIVFKSNHGYPSYALELMLYYFTVDFMLHLLKMNSNSSTSLPVLMNELELNLLQIKLVLLNNTIRIVPVRRWKFKSIMVE